MSKASALSDATTPSYSEVDGAETGAGIDGTGTMSDDGLERTKGEIFIIARKAQTNTNNKIYYTPERE